jgi:tRNA (cmo5U34)-methyltransferase
MSVPAASAAFSEHAGEYDAQRRRLVPPYDDFYGSVTDILELLPGGAKRILDLGAGTGLLSAEIARALPGVQLELLDGSVQMLSEARRRLGPAVTAVHVRDMAQPLPEGPFDAVVSALAIHHLEDSDKRQLFRRVLERLAPGGVFVNAEQVLGPAPSLTRLYADVWTQRCQALGASDEELDGTRERMRHDRCADVESQLRWLREAGFEPADCIFKSWRFAELAAWKESR